MSAAFAPQKGTMPVLQFCPPGMLRIDPLYQRSVMSRASQSLIKQIASGWDWGIYQPLVVARRPDGELYVIDGQHRLEAATLRGDIQQLPCVITSHGDPSDEARAFVAINTARTPLTPVQIFAAAVSAGDADALSVDAILRDADVRLAKGSNPDFWKAGQLVCINAIRSCHRHHGDRVTKLSLQALRQAWPDEPLRYAATIFPGIVPLVGELGASFVLWPLVDLLRSRPQAEWKRDIVMTMGSENLNRSDAATRIVRAAWDAAVAGGAA